jgi:DUF1016 N-terminal domain
MSSVRGVPHSPESGDRHTWNPIAKRKKLPFQARVGVKAVQVSKVTPLPKPKYRGRAVAIRTSPETGNRWPSDEDSVPLPQNWLSGWWYWRLTSRVVSAFRVSSRTYQNMRAFFVTYPIRDALRRDLSWTHYRPLLRVENSDARAFYEAEAVNARWSTGELDSAYENVTPGDESAC